MQINSTTANMETASSFLNKLAQEGFTNNFRALGSVLLCLENNIHYSPDRVRIVDFSRFEGASDPEDNSIVYAIETSDGVKGTLMDAFGPYADPELSKFIKEVEEITQQKRNP